MGVQFVQYVSCEFEVFGHVQGDLIEIKSVNF